MIPYSTQHITDEDIQAVVDQLKSPWLTQGPTVEAFGSALAEYTGANYGIAVANGTAALHLALIALGINDKSIVWTSPNSFAASANCARFLGASVDFVDIDLATFCISPIELEKRLAEAEVSGKLPDVIIPVHHSGFSCDMPHLKSLADRYGFRIVEDACHALGGSFDSNMIGNCAYSDFTVASFHPVKSITTGEGGVVLTNNEGLAHSITLLRSHGITRDEGLMQFADGTPWHYEQVELGFNYRITDIQCALGLSQLKRLDDWVKARNGLAHRYNDFFADTPFAVQKECEGLVSARHLYVIRVPNGKRDSVGKALRAKDILVNVHYEPIHLQPYYRGLGFAPGDFPEAERYGRDALSIPLYPELTEAQQDYVMDSILAAFAKT